MMFVEISDTLAAHPELNASGFLPGGDRAYCDSPRFAEEVARALLWLAGNAIPRGKYAPSSYGLKHTAEHWLRDECGINHAYISNGAFIVAAIIMGYSPRRYGPGNPNCALVPANHWSTE